MIKKVVITSEFFGRFSNEAEVLLNEAGFELVHNPYKKALNEEEVISIVKDAEALICDLEPITKRVIDAAPNLKIISRRGVGVDSVDVEYAKSKNIEVARTLGVVEKPVTELVMSYILGAYRKVHLLDREMKEGKWTKILGNSLDGKVLGIVGLGNIGKELVRKAKAFDMDILYNDVNRNEKAEKELAIKYVTFEELLAKSDIISIHVPLIETTKNMFNYNTMKLMKKKPLLINTARGPIVNEEDLSKALDEGLISYAGIDVFDIEPKTNSPLIKNDNAMLTPHAGTFTREIFIKMDILAAKNVINYSSKKIND